MDRQENYMDKSLKLNERAVDKLDEGETPLEMKDLTREVDKSIEGKTEADIDRAEEAREVLAKTKFTGTDATPHIAIHGGSGSGKDFLGKQGLRLIRLALRDLKEIKERVLRELKASEGENAWDALTREERDLRQKQELNRQLPVREEWLDAELVEVPKEQINVESWYVGKVRKKIDDIFTFVERSKKKLIVYIEEGDVFLTFGKSGGGTDADGKPTVDRSSQVGRQFLEKMMKYKDKAIFIITTSRMQELLAEITDLHRRFNAHEARQKDLQQVIDSYWKSETFTEVKTQGGLEIPRETVEAVAKLSHKFYRTHLTGKPMGAFDALFHVMGATVEAALEENPDMAGKDVKVTVENAIQGTEQICKMHLNRTKVATLLAAQPNEIRMGAEPGDYEMNMEALTASLVDGLRSDSNLADAYGQYTNEQLKEIAREAITEWPNASFQERLQHSRMSGGKTFEGIPVEFINQIAIKQLTASPADGNGDVDAGAPKPQTTEPVTHEQLIDGVPAEIEAQPHLKQIFPESLRRAEGAMLRIAEQARILWQFVDAATQGKMSKDSRYSGVIGGEVPFTFIPAIRAEADAIAANPNTTLLPPAELQGEFSKNFPWFRSLDPQTQRLLVASIREAAQYECVRASGAITAEGMMTAEAVSKILRIKGIKEDAARPIRVRLAEGMEREKEREETEKARSRYEDLLKKQMEAMRKGKGPVL